MHFSMFKRLPAIVLCAALLTLQPACQREKSNKPPGFQKSEAVTEAQHTQAANESAYETVLRELKADPNNIDLIYHLGDLYYRDGLYEKAVENFRKVLAADPSRAYVYLQLGTSLNRLQRYEEALEAFTMAIAKLKDPTVAYNNMGITYGKLGRYQDEIDAMQKALKLRPRYASARYNLGVTYIKVGNLEGARQQYQALQEFDLTMAKALLAEIEKAAPASGNR